MYVLKHICVFLSIICFSCKQAIQNTEKTSIAIEVAKPNSKIDTSDFEKYFISKNLVELSSFDTTIKVSLIYATNQNFLKKSLYVGITKCYLPKEVILKLIDAQKFLKQDFPDYSLIVFDAVRPLSIQKKMWDELDIPNSIKINYLAHPNDISLHNYGAAVDVSIIGENQVLLNMGTEFDYFGELSQPKFEKKLFLQGQLKKEFLANRLLLRSVMIKAGFSPITSEWWHFNYTNKITAASKFSLIY